MRYLFSLPSIGLVVMFMTAVNTPVRADVGITQQAENSKKVIAFTPPKFDYAKVCNKTVEVEKTSVNLPDSALNDSQKLNVAVQLLYGDEGVFPDPMRGIRLLRALIEKKNSNTDRAKFHLARLYLLGRYLPANETRARELIAEIAPSDPYEAGLFLGKLYERDNEYSQAEQLYKRSAVAGNPLAYLSLAYLYRNGFIPNVSQEKINQLVKLSENALLQELAKGNCKIAYDFGKEFLEDDLNPENHKAGVQWLEASSQIGYLSAITELANHYLYGINVPQDEDKGLRYYERAAEYNDAEAFYRLGNYWLVKKASTKENREKGAALLEKAAAQGHQAAIVRLVQFYRGKFGDELQYEKAAQLMQRAIIIPDIDAQIPYMLGEAYALGEGVPKDEVKAFEMYDRAAKLNYRDAILKLGDAYKFGIGMERNPMKSYRFYRQAASVGSRDAMLALVENYRCGVGKSPDKKYEHIWRQRAIHEGAGKELRPEVRRLVMSKNPEDNIAGYMLLKRRVPDDDREAMVMLSYLFEKGIGVKQDTDLAQSWLKQALEPGEEQAKGYLALGESYLDSKMGEFDPVKAAEYMKKSMELGNKDAGYELGKIYAEGARGVSKNIETAKTAFRNAIALGNDNAMRKLAQILIDEGKDEPALALLEKSAAMHNVDSILELLNYYTTRAETDKSLLPKALEWQQKARNHYPCTDHANTKLARLSRKLNTIDGGAIEDTIANIEEAAAAGNVRAMRKMAQRYIYGTEGTPVDPKEAFKWYLKAAQKGDSEAMMEIGNAFSTGLGVTPSKEKAREWWQRAAQAGNQRAAGMLAVDPSAVESAPAKKHH